MVAVGLFWQSTNSVMHKGAIIWDQKLKSTPHPNTPLNPILNTLKNWLNLLLTWRYCIPFLINLSASATFFAILSDTPISLVVPVTNMTTFAATGVLSLVLGEETCVGLALFDIANNWAAAISCEI